MKENKLNKNSKKEIDLLSNDYTIATWPDNKIHSCKFPYLVVRVAYGIFSLVAVPSEVITDGATLVNWVTNFVKKYGYKTALVLEKDESLYFGSDGEMEEYETVPTGGSIVNWDKLQIGEIKSIDQGGDRKIFYTSERDGEIHVVGS